PIRSAGDFAHLVARSPARNQGRHGLRARDTARQTVSMGRAHRRNADRPQGRRGDRVEFPGATDYGCRSDAGLFRLRQAAGNVSMQFIVPLSAREATDASRFGPKAANLARLAQAGLPTPGGFCVDAEAYRQQVRALGLEADARGVFSAQDSPRARRHALAMKLGLLDQPITPDVLDPLLAAWRKLKPPVAVRSSALVEDRFGSSFAGQFESFLGIEDEIDFVTAVRSCWGALWATRALRYMATHDIDPAYTAMAVLVQPVVPARAAGGGISQSAEGTMILTATWGLGSAIAQGEVTPDRDELTREGALKSITAGRKNHQVGCIHTRPVAAAMAVEPCLSESQAVELGRLLRRAEDLMGMPVEIEWAMDDS